jgi:hypothetical protein
LESEGRIIEGTEEERVGGDIKLSLEHVRKEFRFFQCLYFSRVIRSEIDRRVA